MKGKKIRQGKYKVRICIDCGTEIGDKRIKYCIKCARKRWLLADNKLHILKYWRKKAVIEQKAPNIVMAKGEIE